MLDVLEGGSHYLLHFASPLSGTYFLTGDGLSGTDVVSGSLIPVSSTLIVSSGQTSNGLDILNGGLVEVLSSGTVIGTTVTSGGALGCSGGRCAVSAQSRPRGLAPYRRVRHVLPASAAIPGPLASNNGVQTMVNKHVSSILAALAVGAAALVVPAYAQDALEAKLQVCSSCHGQTGQPMDPKSMPIIWGQFENFLTKQLHDYRAGDRANPIMSSMAKTLSQEELRPAAHYFASKMWPARTGPAPAAPATTPNVAQCVACHQPGFVGGAPAPRLAGQTYEYLIKQMNAFSDGSRTNNMDMVKIMQEMSPADRDAIAHYIASL